jgi:hypothetical protein
MWLMIAPRLARRTPTTKPRYIRMTPALVFQRALPFKFTSLKRDIIEPAGPNPAGLFKLLIKLLMGGSQDAVQQAHKEIHL